MNQVSVAPLLERLLHLASTGAHCAEPDASAQFAQAVPVTRRAMKNRQDDVIFLFFELEDELNAFEFVASAKIDCSRRAEKIHSVGTVARPRFNVLEIKAGLFLLKKYSHTLHTAPHQFLLPLPCCLDATIMLSHRVRFEPSRTHQECNGEIADS